MARGFSKENMEAVMRFMFCVVGLFIIFAVPGAAQVQSRPTDPPLVTAVNESWYQLREPVQFAGELYYPAGATVFFNGNTMVRTGHYNGVPLYADTTIEPFSIVPCRSRADFATLRAAGSRRACGNGRQPSAVSVRPTPEVTRPPMAAALQPLAASVGAISVYTPDTASTAVDVG
jgi:hypothetical protein